MHEVSSYAVNERVRSSKRRLGPYVQTQKSIALSSHACFAAYLFQSDSDLDIVDVIEEQASKWLPPYGKCPENATEEVEDQYRYKLQHPKDVSLVRDALDDYVFAHLRRRCPSPPWSTFLYALVMQVGGRLDQIGMSKLRKEMQAIIKGQADGYTTVQAARQMLKALDNYPNDGRPWQFGGLGSFEKAAAMEIVEKDNVDLEHAEEVAQLKAQLEGTAVPGSLGDVDLNNLPGTAMQR